LLSDATNTSNGEAIMRTWFDYDLGSIAVLMIGVCSVALLAMSI
jgi:hypothetical protein